MKVANKSKINFYLIYKFINRLIRTLASLIVKQANTMSLTNAEYMWIMSSIVLCKFEKNTIN
jgi:hypothetical protein